MQFPDIAPVIEGAVQHIASKRLEIGGIELTNLLSQELGKSNPLIKLDISDVEKIKEMYACCAEDDLAYEKMSCQDETHTLPDGQVCTLITNKCPIIVILAGYCSARHFIPVWQSNMYIG